MPSDFRTSCATARASVAVPPVPLHAIRRAASYSPVPLRRPRRTAMLGIGGVVLSVALIAASALLGRAHVSLAPSGAMSLHFPDRTAGGWFAHPTAANLKSAAEAADFPVQYPSGLPKGTTLTMMGRAGVSVILLRYDLPGVWRRDDHMMWIVLANPSAVDRRDVKRQAGEHVIAFGGSAAKGSVRWRVGRETVIVPHSSLRPEELANIRRAMTTNAR